MPFLTASDGQQSKCFREQNRTIIDGGMWYEIQDEAKINTTTE